MLGPCRISPFDLSRGGSRRTALRVTPVHRSHLTKEGFFLCLLRNGGQESYTEIDLNPRNVSIRSVLLQQTRPGLGCPDPQECLSPSTWVSGCMCSLFDTFPSPSLARDTDSVPWVSTVVDGLRPSRLGRGLGPLFGWDDRRTRGWHRGSRHPARHQETLPSGSPRHVVHTLVPVTEVVLHMHLDV